ncbi:MAG TPA: hypothetical protein VLD58_14165 [Gemmatimonadales bacterium]|nr:hypothetical protein [Gemmatimonadales bacterium]
MTLRIISFRTATLALSLAATPLVLSAQAADSSAAARAHYRAAVTSLRGGDTAAALTALGKAAEAWPAQGFYHAARAELAAAAGRTDVALAALGKLIAIGWSWAPGDPGLRPLAGNAAYARLEQEMLRATGPLLRSTVLASLPDSLLHPEGIAWDGARRRWLVSSVRQRKVVAIDARGSTVDLVRSGQDGLDAALALGVDSARGLLWVASAALPQMTGYTPADAGRSRIFAFDLATGSLRRRIELPGNQGGHSVGDLTVALDGTVYASDNRSAAIYRIDPAGGDTARMILSSTSGLRSPQGIVPDGHRLLVADYSLGISAVDLATGAVTTLTPPAEGTVLGIDGLVRLDARRLIGVQNGTTPARVVRLTLTDDGAGVARVETLDRHLPEASEPTLGVLTGGAFVYVANSPWSNYDGDDAVRADAHWPSPVLLRLPIR